jgi:hypothetical protein
MPTRRPTSTWRRILRRLAHAVSLVAVAGAGGESGLLVAKQLQDRGPDHEIYDPGPRRRRPPPGRRRRP